MDEQTWLAERFEQDRPRLRAVAYRMLGSLSEADDAVQEAWLRLSRSDADAIDNLAGWLTTVVSRICLNVLRSRRTRREEPLATHVPDPIVTRRGCCRSRVRRPVGRLGRDGADRGARHAEPGRAARLRVARHVRHPVRRDRPSGGTLAGRGSPAGQPRSSSSARCRGPRRRPRQATGSGRRLLRRRSSG